MKKASALLIGLVTFFMVQAQEETPANPSATAEQKLEFLAEQLETETEDDSFLQSLVQFKKNPLNLNTASPGELRELKLLTDLQIQNLLRYRQLLGNFISIYELQSVPTLDVETIRQMLPYVRVGAAISVADDVKSRLTGGSHSILARAQQVLEASNGFLRPDSIANRYMGSRQRLFFRYKYVYRNLLQYGLVGDKDAGEQLFKGNQQKGFDFYSYHLFIRKLGPVKALALGDFAVNLGQGLIQWQSLAFKKSAEVNAVKRQADVLRPYNSATEYNFQRGVGITLQSRQFEMTLFGSRRRIDANLQVDTAAVAGDFVSSIINTGLHRTPNEVLKKNSIEQTGFGGNLSYNKTGLHLGLNAVAFQFSAPLARDVLPYNQFAIQGTAWHNYSTDFSFTRGNVHFFGEAAMDKRQSKAFLGGLIASLDPKVDASVVYRNIDQAYQSLYGNAFTEGTYPTNEKGLFTGITIKPIIALRIDAFADVFSFPWLRYRVDAPTKGSDYFIQATYKPNKQVEVYTRFKSEQKAINLSGYNLPVRPVFIRPRQNWRTQFSYKASREITIRNRVELTWYDKKEKERSQKGFLTYFDIAYRPMSKPFSANGRLLFFETDGFDSRIYTFENDVLYSFSIPSFFDKGARYYINLNYDVSNRMTMWVRFAQTIYRDKKTIGSGLDEIPGNRRSEIKLQTMYQF